MYHVQGPQVVQAGSGTSEAVQVRWESSMTLAGHWLQVDWKLTGMGGWSLLSCIVGCLDSRGKSQAVTLVGGGGDMRLGKL